MGLARALLAVLTLVWSGPLTAKGDLGPSRQVRQISVAAIDSKQRQQSRAVSAKQSLLRVLGLDLFNERQDLVGPNILDATVTGFGGGDDDGLIGQLFGSNTPSPQSFPDSTCQTEYTDILGGDLNDGRFPGQRTRSPKQCQKRCQDQRGCHFFAWDRFAGYCWLKRSDGLRIPHPKIIIGPKFCAKALSEPSSFQPTTAAREPCAVTIEQIQNGPCDFDSTYSTITGRCNNIKNPNWGAANIAFSRIVSPRYQSPKSDRPRGLAGDLPNVRVVATAFPEKDNPDNRVSSMIMQFGQFLDHDISATSFPEKRCCLNPGRPECFNINVPSSDPSYAQRHNHSSTCIDFVRSRPACGKSTREQVNTITAFIDASNVYGSDDETAQILRSNIGGRLVENEVGPGQLPTKDQLRRPSDHLDDRQDFVAGDLRVNEQPFLTSMHVLFLREHNRLANILQKQLNTENDELLYQSARKLVIIEMQNIVYHEFLPTLLGRRFMEKYKLDLAGDSKYNPNANPSVLNSFATAAFRFGHSMINSLFKVIFTNQEIFWRLSDLFNGKKFNGKHLLDIEPMILGLLNQNAQKVDGSFANELKNHLFTEHSPKRQTHFGGDLVARNIQRGRDHGIPDYNTFRKICNLAPIHSFKQKPLEMSRAMWARFQALYRRVDDIDLYPAAIAENPVDSDALLGPTFSCLIGLQFHNLKYGDRFFFTHHISSLNYLKNFMVEMEQRTLSDVICDNTSIEKVQEKALLSPNRFTNPIRECKSRTRPQSNPLPSNPLPPNPLSSNPPPPPSQQTPQEVNTVKQRKGFLKPQLKPNLPIIPNQNRPIQRIPKSLPPRTLGPIGPSRIKEGPTNTFQPPSIFDALRSLQGGQDFFPRISNISVSKPVKFLERFDHSDAILINP